MAAASSFNGFTPTDNYYVCSVQPEYFEELIAGPEAKGDDDKKEASETADTSEDDEKKLDPC